MLNPSRKHLHLVDANAPTPIRRKKSWNLFFTTLETLPDMNNRSAFRGGMQVHSVPETERAIGANGQRLPWAYEYAE
jgi:hypothetical protein